ncbi:DUF4386 family protein [Chitinophaga caeni]|nr:DUF4386 family protein [Chitinophaga caeni]
MASQQKLARLTGFIYLVVVPTGFFTLGYLPTSFINWKDAGVTAQNIKEAELLFRFGIACTVICYLLF